jgi:hypothetical protein
MGKRAVDLTLEELAALGSKAARKAVSDAQQRGLVVTGTVDFFDEDQAISSLAELEPSGTVVLVEQGNDTERKGSSKAAKPASRKFD